MNTKGLFSSETVEWETPQELFNSLNSKYHFTLDPCSTDKNAKCKKHFTILDNGLAQIWGGRKRIFKPALWQRNWEMDKKSC